MKITRYIFRFPFSLSFFLCFIHLIVDVVCSKSFVRCVNMDVLCFFIRGERKWVMSTEFRFSYLIRVRWWCFKYNWDWSKCLCRQENMLIRMFFSVCVCVPLLVILQYNLSSVREFISTHLVHPFITYNCRYHGIEWKAPKIEKNMNNSSIENCFHLFVTFMYQEHKKNFFGDVRFLP